MTHSEELRSCARYIANGIVVDLWESTNRRPKVREVMDNWIFQSRCANHLNEDDVNEIIERVDRYF
jgi:hypothetical protein